MRKVFNDSMRRRCAGDMLNKVWVETLLHTGHDKFPDTGLSQTCKGKLEFKLITAEAREITT